MFMQCFLKGQEIVAKKIMLLGTMSNVGKTLLAAGLCRVLSQEGFKVMPFKAQNMSLNSWITPDGLEMARAQVIQAEAAGVLPTADMNPLLLKPTGLTGSQVILQGRVLRDMRAVDFYRRKAEFKAPIMESFRRIEEAADIVVIEGAGSPVELNLRKDDLVNMGFAEMVSAPVLLIGDIDPGGVFAQLLGTLELLSGSERARVKGLIVNKFRGDRSLFEDGVRILEERSGLPVVGVVPYTELHLPDEDSMSKRLVSGRLAAGNSATEEKAGKDSGIAGAVPGKCFDIAILRYPRISNFTDFDVFDQWEDISLRFVTRPEEIGRPDLLVLPGSKNTLADLAWIRQEGLDRAVKAYAARGTVLGICGGYQMLGERIEDPEGVEGGGSAPGLGLLPVRTVLLPGKVQQKRQGRIGVLRGDLRELSGCPVSGYEIHMGRTVAAERDDPDRQDGTDREALDREFTDGEALVREKGNIYGTYLHGIFDGPGVIAGLRRSLARLRGITLPEEDMEDYEAFKDREYDRLAEVLRASLDMQRLREIIGI